MTATADLHKIIPANRLRVRPRETGEYLMAECLNQFARNNGVVPVESYKKDGVDGWLFRDRDNRLIFISTLELLSHQPAKHA